HGLPVSGGKILEDDEGSLRLPRVDLERREKRVGYPDFVFSRAHSEMAFTSSIAGHQHPHREETREAPPDEFDRAAQCGNAFDKILLDEKEWLNCANFPRAIFEHKIMMLEV